MKGKLLVGAQALLLTGLAASAWFATTWDIPTWTRGLGLALTLAGAGVCFAAFPQLGRALTPLPEPRADGELITSGLYARMRHPIYTGVLGMGWGWTLMFPSVWSIALAMALTGLFAVKSRYEERLLLERFEEYAEYAARTPRFVPRPW